MRKVFLDELPRWMNGSNKGQINWLASVKSVVNFIYDDIKGAVEIVDYINEKIYVKYLNNEPFKMCKSVFLNCNFGALLGKTTNDFKLEIGKRLVDYNKDGSIKRDITIIDRKINTIIDNRGYNNNQKWYKYRCNKCEFDGGRHYFTRDNEYKDEYWITEGSLLKGIGCACCCNSIVVKGINDMWTTNPSLAKLLLNPEDGYKHTENGGDSSLYWVCQDCGNEIYRRIGSVKNRGLSCPRCGDSISYPEKFMYNVLKQLNLSFQIQLNKTTFNWIGNYKYDFYFEINNEQYIIETHGRQHYEEGFKHCGGRTIKEEKENDKLKKELAINNGINKYNYIIIDCRESDLEFIKNNILHSRLNNIFDLSKINWNECHEFALSSLVKRACELWDKNINYTTSNIGKIIGLSKHTIELYLLKGVQLGWCEYSPKHTRRNAKNIKSLSKQVAIYRDNVLLEMFPSNHELERQSKNLFGTKLRASAISEVCTGKKEFYKGYTFKYVTDEEYKKYLKQQELINNNKLNKEVV